jgi:type I restriction enzyme S subunit
MITESTNKMKLSNQANPKNQGSDHMKESWEIKKLSDLSKHKDAIVSGPFGSNLKVSDYKASGVPIFRLQNVGKGYFINKDIKYIDEKKAEELKYHSFKSGDLVLAKLGIPVGKTCIVPEEFTSGIIVADVVRIRPDKDIVDYKFLEYFLNTDQSVAQLTGNITGATRPRVNLSDVRSIEVYLPPLPEQQRIVSILDRAFAAIDQAKANYEKCLSLSKGLFESFLQRVFENQENGWEELKLKEIGLTQTGNTPKTSEKENYGDYIPFIKPADVDFTGVGDLRYDNNGLSETGFRRARSMKKGSTLMVCIGATIGKVGFAEQDVTSNQQINSLTVGADYFPKFFYYALTSRVFQEKVLSAGKGAQATLPIINKSKWESLTIAFPKLKSEQESYSERFDALRTETQKLETLYQKKIAALDELKKSILQKAFQGELETEKELAL